MRRSTPDQVTILVVAGRTAPNRAVRFGGEHDALDERGRNDAAALAASVPPGSGPVLIGPERSVRQTADAAGVDGVVDDALASLDLGAWRGRRPEELDPMELGAWFADPTATPHGGESVSVFLARIREHVDAVAPGLIVVAKPVAQALLCDGPADFFATDVRPATVHARTVPSGG